MLTKAVELLQCDTSLDLLAADHWPSWAIDHWPSAGTSGLQAALPVPTHTSQSGCPLNYSQHLQAQWNDRKKKNHRDRADTRVAARNWRLPPGLSQRRQDHFTSPSGWSQTPCNHHPSFNQSGDTFLSYNYNKNSDEYFFTVLRTPRLFNKTKSICDLNVAPGVNVYQKKVMIQEICKDCSLSQSLSYPLFATVMETVSTFFADQYCTWM